LFKQLDREREQAEEFDVRLFDKAKRAMAGQKPERISEAGLVQIIQDIGRRMKTSLSADEMNAARLEGRK
jgi:hypothetical protein